MIIDSLMPYAAPIDTLTPMPGNPRKGRVEVIADLLAYHGQVRPIVARKDSGVIIAGNHTWQAAKALGWEQIAVVYVDVDDATADEIALIDNKAADNASNDDEALLRILESLPSLAGTGYDDDAFDRLRESLMDTEAETGSTGGQGATRKDRKVKVGDYAFMVARDDFDAWADDVKAAHEDKATIIEWLRESLGLPTMDYDVPRRACRHQSEDRDTTHHPDLLVPIDSVEPYEDNPRRGDVNMIARSLKALGQYKPIVVNQRTLRILAGNHTWHAAKRLGWEQIAVTFVDMDAADERAYVIGDNRASDVSGWDDRLLASVLAHRDYDVTNTGFTEHEVDRLLADIEQTEEQVPVRCIIGTWTFATPKGGYEAWKAALVARVGELPSEVCPEVCRLIGLDPSAIA